MCAKKLHTRWYYPKQESYEIKRRREKRRERRKRDRYMTKKYGKHGHGACGRKRRYGSEAAAMSRANMCMTLYGFSFLRPYKCKYCGGWHLTSMPYGKGDD